MIFRFVSFRGSEARLADAFEQLRAELCQVIIMSCLL